MGNIRLKNVTLKYENSVIIDDVSENFRDGELVAILGPTGCGKTTLLKIIAGLTLADSGSIEINGENIRTFSQKRMLDYHKDCGFIFQNSALISNMSIYENLSLYYNYHTKKTEKEIYELIQPFLEYVGFNDDLSVRPTMISTGEKMQVSIVRAICHNPVYVFWDNPLPMLDSMGQKRVKQIIIDLKHQKKTMILVTNDFTYALSIADRISIMNKGKIVESGTPREIKNSKLKITRELITK